MDLSKGLSLPTKPSKFKSNNKTVTDLIDVSSDQKTTLAPKSFGPKVATKRKLKRRLRTPQNEKQKSFKNIRNLSKIDIFEILLTEESRLQTPKSLLKHFFLMKNFDQFSNFNKNDFLMILSLSSKSRTRTINPMSLTKDKVNQAKEKEEKKRYSQSEMNTDSFYKRIMRQFWKYKFFEPRMANKQICELYLSKRGHDKKLNICSGRSKERSHYEALTEDLGLWLNCDLAGFLRSFFSSSISYFLYTPRNISKFYENSPVPEEVRLNFSKHLSLQRKILPFPQARTHELRMAILTWNIAGKNMKKNSFILTQILKKMIRSQPDLLVLGFQEIVELKMSFTNLKKIMFQCEEISLDIKKLVDQQVHGQFVCISALNVMGILQLVYVHRSLLSALDPGRFGNWNLKFGGKAGFKMGNKGAVSCLLKLKGFGSLTFSNCHLTHGFDKVKKRVSKLKKIIDAVNEKRGKLGVDGSKNTSELVRSDFILGDFNMLVELTREEIQPIIYDWQNFQNNMDKIFDNEQLKRTMKQEKLLKEFKEHTIGKIFLL